MHLPLCDRGHYRICWNIARCKHGSKSACVCVCVCVPILSQAELSMSQTTLTLTSLVVHPVSFSQKLVLEICQSRKSKKSYPEAYQVKESSKLTLS